MYWVYRIQKTTLLCKSTEKYLNFMFESLKTLAQKDMNTRLC